MSAERAAYELVDVPNGLPLPERHVATYRFRWRARWDKWLLEATHRWYCRNADACSGLWHYEVRPVQKPDPEASSC